MTTPRRHRETAAAALLCLFACGCETVPDTSSDVGSIIVLQQVSTGRSVTAAHTHEPSAGIRRFRIAAGDHDGSLLKRETMDADRFDADWMTIESIVTDDGPIPRRTEYWSIDEHGSAVLHASVDHEEEAITLFKPPLVTMPAELTPGEMKTYESQVRIVAEHDIARRKESGVATQLIRHTGDIVIRAARGETQTSVVVVEFEADLAMADAFETTTRFISADQGIVAIERTRKVNILGLPGSEHRETLHRLSAK